MVCGLFDRRFHALFLADIALYGQRLAASGLDSGGGGVDRAFQLGVRIGGLGRDRDIGAVTCAALRDGKANAPAGPGNEDGLAA